VPFIGNIYAKMSTMGLPIDFNKNKFTKLVQNTFLVSIIKTDTDFNTNPIQGEKE